MNDGSFMMLPSKNETMIRVPQKHIKSISFKKKENEVIQNYVDAGIENYVVFIIEQISLPKHDEEISFQGFWKFSFDGVCSKFGNGADIIFKTQKHHIYPHVIILEFPCINNEEKYKDFIQGMILSL